MFDMIAFDADDTLWHNETLFSITQERFQQLLSGYHDAELTGQKLYETEMRNLAYFGYGIKGFTLSMIETAIELTHGKIQGREIQDIIDLAKAMVKAPVQLLDRVEEVIERLSESYTLMLITKGDLFDQEAKIAQSGLAERFTHIEIVSEKSAESYRALLAKHKIDIQRFVMVGNSLRSDIFPVLAIGGRAVHIPYHVTWAHEAISHRDIEQKDYFELEHIGLLPELIARLHDT